MYRYKFCNARNAADTGGKPFLCHYDVEKAFDSTPQPAVYYGHK